MVYLGPPTPAQATCPGRATQKPRHRYGDKLLDSPSRRSAWRPSGGPIISDPLTPAHSMADPRGLRIIYFYFYQEWFYNLLCCLWRAPVVDPRPDSYGLLSDKIIYLFLLLLLEVVLLRCLWRTPVTKPCGGHPAAGGRADHMHIIYAHMHNCARTNARTCASICILTVLSPGCCTTQCK